MARMGTFFLDNGDLFPGIGLDTVSGEIIQLPEALGPGYSVVLFYRGHW